MYSKAHALNPQDADCLYNWYVEKRRQRVLFGSKTDVDRRGRVIFLLAGFLPEHATPEDKVKMLDQSIKKFRAALNLEHDKSDAQFNLAQALHQKSEVLQEATDIENSYQQSAMGMYKQECWWIRVSVIIDWSM